MKLNICHGIFLLITYIWNPSQDGGCLVLKLLSVKLLYDHCSILYLSNRMCVFQLLLKDASSNSFLLWQYLWQFSGSSAVAAAHHWKDLKTSQGSVRSHICLWRILPAFQPKMCHCWLVISHTKELASVCFESRDLASSTEGPGGKIDVS